MIDMYIAHTSEIDEIEDAINELKSQIDFSLLKKNSGGIILCNVDFVESGVVAALCDALPFDVIGSSTMAYACPSGAGLFGLTLTILTSDEVSFKAQMSNAINKTNYETEIENLCKDMRGKVAEDPALIISFIPCISSVSGNDMVKAADKAVGGAPIWGSLTCNMHTDYENIRTICNGESLREGAAMMFLNGPVEPKFIITSLPEYNISNTRGIVTKSNGAILSEVNDMPILEYFGNMGLVLDQNSIKTTPVMVYYENSTKPVAYAIFELFEDGSCLVGGDMPAGCAFSVGIIDERGIYQSCESGLDEILKIENRQATLVMPCISRGVMLAPDQEGEIRLIHERLKQSGLPFSMGYAGGEVCPVPDADGKLHNRFHNYTFCACVL